MSRRLTTAAAAALFLVLACVMTFPLVRFDRPTLPDSDDAYFSVWRIAWLSHQIVRDPAHLFDANIFFPADHTLAYSDAMPALGVLASPAIGIGVAPAAVHNVLVIAAFLASACAAFALCLELSGSVAAAVLGGVIFAFAPFRLAHVGHLELLWTAPMPLAVLVLHRAFTGKRPIAHGLLLGGLVALQAFCSVYYAVFLVIFLGAWTVIASVLQHRLPIAVLKTTAIGACVVLGLIAPYAAVYAAAREQVGVRSQEEIRTFSATPADYLRVAPGSKTYPARPGPAPDEKSLFPGLIAIALALTALARRRGAAVATYAVLAVLTFDLSLGLNGITYRALSEIVPILDGLRAPARFSSLFLLSLSVLAAIGLAAMTNGRPPRHRAAIAVATLTLCTAEYWCAPIAVRPAITEPPAVYRWLDETKPRLIVELPLPSPSALWYLESTHEYMSIFHWTPLVNGYSGHAPRAYIDTLEVMQSFPSPESVARLRSLGVQHVVVHERYYDAAALESLVGQLRASRAFANPIRRADPVDPALVFPLVE